MTTVLEIGHIAAGPTTGLIVSDLVFEVIKIERAGYGDFARYLTFMKKGTLGHK